MRDPAAVAQIILAFAALTTFLAGFSAFRWHDQLDKRANQIEAHLRYLQSVCKYPDGRPYPGDLRRIAEPIGWALDPVAAFTLTIASAAALVTIAIAVLAWDDSWSGVGAIATIGATAVHVAIAAVAIFDYQWVHRRQAEVESTSPAVVFVRAETALREGRTREAIAECRDLHLELPGWVWTTLLEAEAELASEGSLESETLTDLDRCVAVTDDERSIDDDALLAWAWAQGLRGKAAIVGTRERQRLDVCTDGLAPVVRQRMRLSSQLNDDAP